MKSLNRWGNFVLVTLLASLVGSCGGGGGGGSSGGSSGGGSGNLTFTANRASLTFDYMEGTTAPSLDVIVTATGNYTGTLYLGATVTGTGLNSTIPVVVNSTTQGTFTVTAASGIAVGDYTGTLRLLACSDQACSHQVGNSPLTLTYTTRVHTRLHVSSNAVALTSHSDAGTTSDVTVTLPWQSTSFTPTVEMGSDFLSVSQPTATTLRLSARAWPSGQRTGVVRVDSGGQTEMISVTYDVTPPAGGEFNLRSTPNALMLSAVERTSTAPRTLTILGPTWEPGLVTETFTDYSALGSSAEWLQVETVAGGYRLTASAAQLNTGSYTARLIVRASSTVVPSQQIEIPVSFTVGEGLALPPDLEVTLDANTTAQSPLLSGTIPITLVDGPAVTWTAQSDSNWFSLTRSSGQTGTNLTYNIDPTLLDLTTSYGPRDFVATVQITAAPFLTPRTFHVNVHQRLAHVRGIAPYYQVAGQPSRHVVRGTGFIANRDWSQYLYIMGAAPRPGQVTRINDTELIVDLDADQTVIEPQNALSSVPSWDAVRVIQAPANTYQALTTGFEVSRLHYDAQRQQLVVADRQANDQNNRLIRYTKSGGNWAQSSSTVVAGLKDMLVTNDNTTLWLVTSSGLQFAPLDTLQISAGNPDTTFAPMHIPSAQAAMAMTNDSRLWFGSEDAQGFGNGILYRDLLAGDGLNLALESDLIQPREGPWFTVSGNGERLYISQATSVAPAPSLLALDAKDGVLFEAPSADSTYLPSDAAINLDGSRLIGTGYEVRDLAYADIGSVDPAHENYTPIASAVNPAGTRTYVLAYDGNDIGAGAPQMLPRVYVFNTSSGVGSGVRMPLRGYFTLADYPTCRTAAPCLYPGMKLSPDGNTLFIAGSAKLLVVPVPNENTLTIVNKIRPAATGMVTKPWRVETRSN